MRDSTRVVVGRAMSAVAGVGAVSGVIWLWLLGYTDALWGDWVVHNAIIAIGSGVIVWTVVRSQPRNAEIWVFAWAGLLTGLLCFTYAAAGQLMTNVGSDIPLLEIVPSEVPLPVALLMMNANWLWLGVFLPFTLGLQLFPDGQPASPRWRWAIVATIFIISMVALGLFWEARPSGVYSLTNTQDTNGGLRSITSSIVTIGYPLLFVMVLVSVAALVLRFRRSTGFERQQFRWVVWGASLAGVMMFAALMIDEVGGRIDIALSTGALAMAFLLSSFGIAIAKYRIYDIDVVISRTLVYGVLALFIGAVYVGIVVGVGVLLDNRDEPSLWLGVIATVVVAMAFQPARRWLQKVANRIVYGRRISRYEVLSTFSQTVAAVDPQVLSQVSRSLTDGTTATAASIWIARDSELHRIAAWPEDSALPIDVPGRNAIPNADRVADVIHDGDVLGHIGLSLPAGQSFDPTDEELLEQVASGLGLALRNLLLTDDLQSRVDQLRESRRRIVALQDQTRQMLERDLHDGAQQRLVALKIKVGLAGSMAEKEGLGDVKGILDTVRGETDLTIESLRNLARGIYPPLLEAEGLGAALTAQLRRAPLPVTVQAAGISRQPRHIEATVYFCVLEAVQNSIKHARANSVLVALLDDHDQLTFEVRDDGIGFDATVPAEGHGLQNMADRLDAVNGSLAISSSAGHGTTITGTIPVVERVMA